MEMKVKNTINETYIKDDTVHIKLLGGNGEGYTAITDVDSYLKYELYKYRWRCNKKGYVYTSINNRTKYMHRIITENNTPIHTDHIKNTSNSFLDKLDNRSCNLRFATNQQNQQNARKRKDNTTGYKGVSIDNGAYKVQLRINKKKLYFGGFKTDKYEKSLIMSACIYDVVSEYVFGEYADHNKIREKDLLTDDELTIVLDTAFKFINKHKVNKYEKKQNTYDMIALDGVPGIESGITDYIEAV
ncbi:hypothetical protein [Fictibacillus phosphorivorans]|uniref:hypothetical protein n=1 Tax=Fictibacillus phosphorivorans TaxID=1221500 RepID=UPI0035E6C51F